MSERAQLRQQLLASDSNVDTLSGFAASGRMQIPNSNLPPQHPVPGTYRPGNNYSNHDLIAPIDTGAIPSSSRKASMTSSASGMQKFFRRRDNGAAFDDDLGADIGDVSGGEISFSDITHLRDTGGRYNVTHSMMLDSSAPIIPVLGPGHMPGSAKNMSNIQYRKQMNHLKKMNLASSARAMSLAGGPMNGNPAADPRSMSFSNASYAAPVPNGRAMSLGPTSGGPRTMSLNSNVMNRHQGPMNGPRLPMNGSRPPMNGPMVPQMGPRGAYPGRPGNQVPGSPNMGPGGPRAMSLRSGNVPPQMRGMQPSARLNSLNGPPPAGPRSQSFTQSASSPNFNQRPYNPNMYSQQYGPQYQGSQPYIGHPMYGNQGYVNPPYGSGPRNIQPDQTRGMMNPDSTMSSDSLMNVVEEEAEPERSHLDPGSKTDSFNFQSTRDNEISEEDHVYRFEDDAAGQQLSRKSTIKKADSMRVRRLDLFNKGSDTAASANEDAEQNEEERSFNVNASGDRTSKKLFFQLDDAETNEHQLDLANKLKSLGASAAGDDDIFFTTPEFESPTKKEMNDINKTQPERLSVPQKVKPNTKEAQIKLHRLAENTVFSKFRNTSQEVAADVSSNGQPLLDRSETDSQSSVYSAETPKLSDSLNALVSPSSYLPSINDAKVTSPQVFEAPKSDPQSLPSPEYAEDDGKYDSSVASSSPGSTQEKQNHVPELRSNTTEKGTPVDDELETDVNLNEGPKRNLSQQSTDTVNLILQRRTSTLSRSGSELKLQGLLPAGGLITVQQPNTNTGSETPEPIKSELSRSKGSLLSSKSKNFIKRLSRSTSKRNISDDLDDETHSAMSRLRVASSVSIHEPAKKPLTFTKEELAIMTCNNDLQNDLQLVTSELALSIKRELALESRLKSKPNAYDGDESVLQHQILEKSKVIADLQDKLNNERRLRFISEEHAILSENGQTPSALKLDYEKNELYKQLLAKSDMVNQLQDKLDEYETSTKKKYDDDLLQKYNELLNENTHLRQQLENVQNTSSSVDKGDLTLIENHEYEQAQIISLRTQRDELREMITKLTSSQSAELTAAHDRIHVLEEKLKKVNMINDKLSKRGDRPENPSVLGYGSGGKLQGFDVVSLRKSVLDN